MRVQGQSSKEVTMEFTSLPTISKLAGFQSILVGECVDCGASAYYCEDWEAIRWEGSAEGCLCHLDPKEVPAFLRDLINEDGHTPIS